MAQLVARFTCNEKVAGSSPARGSPLNFHLFIQWCSDKPSYYFSVGSGFLVFSRADTSERSSTVEQRGSS